MSGEAGLSPSSPESPPPDGSCPTGTVPSPVKLSVQVAPWHATGALPSIRTGKDRCAVLFAGTSAEILTSRPGLIHSRPQPVTLLSSTETAMELTVRGELLG